MAKPLCITCGKPFSRRNRKGNLIRTKACGMACWRAHLVTRWKRCVQCGFPFPRSKSMNSAMYRAARFCSVECRRRHAIANGEHRPTPEGRRRYKQYADKILVVPPVTHVKQSGMMVFPVKQALSDMQALDEFAAKKPIKKAAKHVFRRKVRQTARRIPDKYVPVKKKR